MKWNDSDKKFFNLGLSHGILFVHDPNDLTVGIPWEGLISIKESPGKSEVQNLWMSNREYAQLVDPETFSGTIEAYSYPIEFEKCIGITQFGGSLLFDRQKRRRFSLCYRTEVYNDTGSEKVGYIVTFLYNLIASSSEQNNVTINSTPEAKVFSWEVSSLPMSLDYCGEENFHSVSKIVIDSRRTFEAFLWQLDDLLYRHDVYLSPCDLIAIEHATSGMCDNMAGTTNVPVGTLFYVPYGCTLSCNVDFIVEGTLLVYGTLVAE
jgi:hypothetical protein